MDLNNEQRVVVDADGGRYLVTREDATGVFGVDERTTNEAGNAGRRLYLGLCVHWSDVRVIRVDDHSKRTDEHLLAELRATDTMAGGYAVQVGDDTVDESSDAEALEAASLSRADIDWSGFEVKEPQ